ncbi:MAG: hypothetical protein OXP28_14310 [Gammaproteobacteria bacterium]|nr:hypothetical protein [Gammaproteobacteria bacterium]
MAVEDRIASTAPFGRAGLLLVVAAWAVISLTPFGTWLESRLVSHVLVEIPVLVAIGFVLGRCIEPRLRMVLEPLNGGGIPGILLVTFALAFWMIPRWLDASLQAPDVAAAKYISLVALAGMPLAWSWDRLHPVARGLVKIEFLAMCFRLGWLYLISPDRLCNSYLIDDQVLLGQGLLVVGIALSITWLYPVFFGVWSAPSPRGQGEAT